MFLNRSFRRRLVATAGAAFALAFLYEVTALDSRYAARQAEQRQATAAPSPGARLRFAATAYCKGLTTKSGVQVRTGIVAADPDLLPVGSVIQLDSLGEKYNGLYTVLDTGPKVQGRHIDVYMWSCYEALDFGRRPVQLTVLRLGWNPKATGDRMVDRLLNFRKTIPVAATTSVPAPPPATAAADPTDEDQPEQAAPVPTTGPK
jgi:3D (Asp-Asp-Asp) domain-containing protein